MRRKKFAEIITKEDRQEFLNYILEKELEKIRKKMYKYQRCDTLWYPITIEEKDLTDLNASGRYEWDDENEVHKIEIDSKVINEYLSNKYSGWYKKKYRKHELIDTIGHELCHGYCRERLEHTYSKIKYTHRDGSPVFLALLQYLGYSSGHRCNYNYSGSNLWSKVCELKKNNASYDVFLTTILCYLHDIDSLRRELNEKYKYIEIDENNHLSRTIDFEFSGRGSGLRKHSQIELDVKAFVKNKRQFKTIKTISTTFSIGSGIDASEIKKLIHKKLDNGQRADIEINDIKKLVYLENDKDSAKWLYEKREEYSKFKEQNVAQVIK